MRIRFNIRRYFQVLGITLAVVVAAAAICLGMNYSKLLMSDGQETVLADVDNGKINLLALGVDVDGLRTDAMMVFSFDTKTKEINVLTIPRDTKMFVGNRYQKINAAHAYIKNGKIGGAEASVEAVQRITGIPINFYAEFSFDAVAHVINILGPIEFTIPDLYNDGVGMVYDDPVQGLHINLPPGKYGEGADCDYPGLNGSQAVQLLRYRHGNEDPVTKTFKGYTNGDEDRTQVQQQFIKAVIDQKLNASLILKIPEIYQELESEIKTNATFSDVIKYAGNLSGVSSASMHSYTLPGSFDYDSSIGDVWEVDLDATRELIQTVFGYDASNITIENPEEVSSSTNTADTADSYTPPEEGAVSGENIGGYSPSNSSENYSSDTSSYGGSSSYDESSYSGTSLESGLSYDSSYDDTYDTGSDSGTSSDGESASDTYQVSDTPSGADTSSAEDGDSE